MRSLQVLKIGGWVFRVFLLTSNCEAFAPENNQQKVAKNNVVPKGVGKSKIFEIWKLNFSFRKFDEWKEEMLPF